MIVKNEEEDIGRALNSVRPVVDEMIVVDTGSTDRTKEIARSLGAKVYDFRWNDSFAEARNFSISKATGKWILVLDADEVISAQDHEKLKELVHPTSSPLAKGGQRGVTAYSFVTRTYVTDLNTTGWTANDGQYKDEEAGTGWFPGEKVRMFPNDSRVRFDFPLHERIEPSLIKAGIKIEKCDIPVHHYGNFLEKEKADSKADLYYELGKKKIEEKGKSNFMAYYELALQGAELGKYDETLEFLKKAIALKPDFGRLYQSMGNAYYNLGRYGEALSSYRKAFELDHNSRDSLLMYATCEILAGDTKKSVSLLEGFSGIDASFPQATLLLAEAYFCLGENEKGLKYVRQLRDVLSDAGRHLIDFARILIRAGRLDYASSLLQSAIETGNAADETAALLAECRKTLKNEK
jgi:glycosyltransferase involved in cell wall biosynthesis